MHCKIRTISPVTTINAYYVWWALCSGCCIWWWFHAFYKNIAMLYPAHSTSWTWPAYMASVQSASWKESSAHQSGGGLHPIGLTGWLPEQCFCREYVIKLSKHCAVPKSCNGYRIFMQIKVVGKAQAKYSNCMILVKRLAISLRSKSELWW